MWRDIWADRIEQWSCVGKISFVEIIESGWLKLVGDGLFKSAIVVDEWGLQIFAWKIFFVGMCHRRIVWCHLVVHGRCGLIVSKPNASSRKIHFRRLGQRVNMSFRGQWRHRRVDICLNFFLSIADICRLLLRHHTLSRPISNTSTSVGLRSVVCGTLNPQTLVPSVSILFYTFVSQPHAFGYTLLAVCPLQCLLYCSSATPFIATLHGWCTLF